MRAKSKSKIRIIFLMMLLLVFTFTSLVFSPVLHARTNEETISNEHKVQENGISSLKYC